MNHIANLAHQVNPKPRETIEFSNRSPVFLDKQSGLFSLWFSVRKLPQLLKIVTKTTTRKHLFITFFIQQGIQMVRFCFTQFSR
jgi:hypothetical protein